MQYKTDLGCNSHLPAPPAAQAKLAVEDAMRKQIEVEQLTREEMEQLLQDPGSREMHLGERVHALVILLQPPRPQKVTGMLLDGLDPSELLAFLMPDDPVNGATFLVDWVAEACKVLAEACALCMLAVRVCLLQADHGSAPDGIATTVPSAMAELKVQRTRSNPSTGTSSVDAADGAHGDGPRSCSPPPAARSFGAPLSPWPKRAECRSPMLGVCLAG